MTTTVTRKRSGTTTQRSGKRSASANVSVSNSMDSDETKEILRNIQEALAATRQEVKENAKTIQHCVSRLSELDGRVIPLEVQRVNGTNGTVSNLTSAGLTPQQERNLKTELRRVLKRKVFDKIKFLSPTKAERLHEIWIQEGLITNDVKPVWLSQQINRLRTNSQTNVKNKWKKSKFV